jgi:hypothetical protein
MGTQTDRWPLDPINRLSEVMFGLLRTLTFTGMMRAALGQGRPREILLAALGCSIAWGLVDATVCLQTAAILRGRGPAQAVALRAASDPAAKAQLCAQMPGRACEALSDAQLGAALGWMGDTRPGPDGSPFCGGRISGLRAGFFAGDRCYLSADRAVSSW